MESWTGWITPLLTGALSFFLIRFINRYDKFEEETTKKLNSLDRKISNFEKILESINNNVHDAKIDTAFRTELIKLKGEIESYSDVLNGRLSKVMDKMDDNFGKVVWIKDFKETTESQERKIMGLYKTIQKLIQKNN